MKLLILLLFSIVYSSQVYAYVGIELASPQGRYEINSSGSPSPFINAPTIDWKIFYQQNTQSNITWGVSYYSQSMDFSGGNDGLTFEDTTWTRSQITGYIALGSKQGHFFNLGIHRTTTPYFITNNGVIEGENFTRNDIFLKGGVYYKTGFGGGEVTLKYIFIPQVEVSDNDLAGSGSEIYFSMYLNKSQNFGIFFKYLNEFTNGDYDHVYDARSLGIVARM
jgi:hypothetical protein